MLSSARLLSAADGEAPRSRGATFPLSRPEMFNCAFQSERDTAGIRVCARAFPSPGLVARRFHSRYGVERVRFTSACGTFALGSGLIAPRGGGRVTADAAARIADRGTVP